MNNQELNKNIMRRVYIVHRLRKIFSPLGLKMTVFLFLLALELLTVSVWSVAVNFFRVSKDFGTAYDFIINAFLNTGLVVQAVSAALFVLAVLFAWDLYKTYTVSDERYQSTV